jgi:hypothetical protein
LATDQDAHDLSAEARAASPGEIFSAAGKVYRKLPDGTVQFIGYQDVGDDPEHEPGHDGP